MNSSITWIKDVRSSVKHAYGSGWVIEEKSWKVKILRRMPETAVKVYKRFLNVESTGAKKDTLTLSFSSETPVQITF